MKFLTLITAAFLATRAVLARPAGAWLSGSSYYVETGITVHMPNIRLDFMPGTLRAFPISITIYGAAGQSTEIKLIGTLKAEY